jgi:uncharacterized membrane-anchored protein
VAQLRRELHAEIHARPYPLIQSPALVTYLVLRTQARHGATGASARDELIAHFGLPAAHGHEPYYSGDGEALRLVWEQHTEFCRMTLTQLAPSGVTMDRSVPRPAATSIPAAWLARWDDSRLIHSECLVLRGQQRDPDLAAVAEFFGSNDFAGSQIAGGAATVFSDFSVDDAGLNRTLLMDHGMNATQTGRNVQRLLEIYTYWLMALLAFPVARALLPYLTERERELQTINEQLIELTDPDMEARILNQLTRFEAELSQKVSRNAFRFGAAEAYFEIVQRRLGDLREERVPGLQTVAEFALRRLAPAMQTCRSVSERQQRLSERAFGVTRLLATRIELAVQLQNREVLTSLDRRAALQLRLQSTVEGLSIAAITYYLVGLVGYLVQALIELGVPLSKNVSIAVAIPVIALLVALLVRRVRARLHAAVPD